MKTHRSHLFIENPSSRRWLDEIINYISASYTNPVLWKVIQEVASMRDAKRTKFIEQKALQEGVKVDELPREYLEFPVENAAPDQFSSIDFYLSLSMNINRGNDHAGGALHSVGEAFQLLLDAHVLLMPYNVYHRDSSLKIPSVNGQAYHINKEFSKYLISNGLIYNHLFGFNYIIDKYSRSVVKIEVKQGQDFALGTGWIYDIKTGNSSRPIRLVITNDHVLNGSSSIRILDVNDRVINYRAVELLQKKTGIDIALLQIEYDEIIPAFLFHLEVSLLEDVITIGYPSVPLSRAAYQLVHRGEVNAQVTDYFGQDLLVISSRTAPGNSGSPVIDDTGRVIGMIAQQLFEKESFEQKGVTPYSACVPAAALLQAIAQAELFISLDTL